MVLHVAVAGHALAVVERDGTSDPATSRVLTGSWLWDSSPLSRSPERRGRGLPRRRPLRAHGRRRAAAGPQGQRGREQAERRASQRAGAPVGRPALARGRCLL